MPRKPPPPPVERTDSSAVPAVNLDNYFNALTGIGDPARDKTKAVDFLLQLLTGPQCEERWRGSDMGARVVETIPNEMTRRGFTIQIQPDDGEADAPARADWGGPPEPTTPPPPRELSKPDDSGQRVVQALETKLRTLKARSKLRQALCYQRAFGGGAVLLGCDDGPPGGGQAPDGSIQAGRPLKLDASSARLLGVKRLDADDPRNLSAPLDEERISTVRHLTAFRGGWDGEVIAWDYHTDPTAPNFGEPRIYMLRNLGVPLRPMQAPTEMRPPTPPSTPTMVRYVHASRLLVFPGTPVSHFARVQQRGWSDSVFVKLERVLSGYDQTWNSVTNLLSDWAQGVMKMPDLMGMLAAGQEQQIVKRALMVNMARSVARVMLLDEREDFKREVAPLAGIPDILREFANRLAAAADMPVTLLMGQAPAGLSATGESDVRFFYDRVEAMQAEHLTPQIERLVRLLLLAADGPTAGREPKQWTIVQTPVWQLTDAELATLRKTQADADHIYIADQVLTPEEVAVSRFGGSRYSTDTVLDFEGRARMAKEAKAEQERQAAQAPPADALAGAVGRLERNRQAAEQGKPQPPDGEEETGPGPRGDAAADQPRHGGGRFTSTAGAQATIAQHVAVTLGEHGITGLPHANKVILRGRHTGTIEIGKAGERIYVGARARVRQIVEQILSAHPDKAIAAWAAKTAPAPPADLEHQREG